MPFTSELTFGVWQSGMYSDPGNQQLYRTIQLNAGFSPLSLSPQVWYDPSDLSSMFQDSAGTIPAAVNSPVGKLNDKSGNGNHAIQGTAGSRPILRQSGALYYLEFDGVDDNLTATFTLNQPFDRVSALQMVTYTVADRLYGGVVANAGVLWTPGPSPDIALFDGSIAATNSTATVATNFVATERHNGANGRIAVNNGSYTTGDSGTTVPGGIQIGDGSFAGAANIYFFGMAVKSSFTDPETALLRTYFGAKAGLVL